MIKDETAYLNCISKYGCVLQPPKVDQEWIQCNEKASKQLLTNVCWLEIMKKSKI